ncbi:hypothetical protein PATY110618_08665 [Paenibacillus typhae]|uniref:Uncharacterized protein n=1 Tax=Paenibacillus typhae TaxID=1174501 RepID=A0A1G8ERP2_9BACL|nr:hypothetical protein SAMN05216192_1016 [Paenibacillus typhae]
MKVRIFFFFTKSFLFFSTISLRKVSNTTIENKKKART